MIYILIILLMIIIWIGLFHIFKNSQDENPTKRKLIGISIFGPLWIGIHPYMKKHGWKLTQREIIGWIIVILLMLFAPLISYYLGN